MAVYIQCDYTGECRKYKVDCGDCSRNHLADEDEDWELEDCFDDYE